MADEDDDRLVGFGHRDRVTLLEADMTSFDLDRRFAQIYCAGQADGDGGGQGAAGSAWTWARDTRAGK